MTSLRWVSSTETGSIGLKPCALDVLDEGLGNRDRLHAESRLAHFVAGHIGPGPVADDDQILADPEFLGRDRRRRECGSGRSSAAP